jgi:hypothetical protein
MAHFAELDEFNTVKQVIVVHNNELLDENNQESEVKGIKFCKSLFGEQTAWVQTSFNSTFRKHYAGIGYSYDPIEDYFVPPQPFPSWILNTESVIWEAPVLKPSDGKRYVWNESGLEWVEIPESE